VTNDRIRAIDTNLIVRYVVADDPAQSLAARRVIESDELLGITPVALAEAAWTLTGSVYRIGRSHVAEALLHLLARQNITCLGFAKQDAQAALLRCRPDAGAADFGDALIAASARSAGVTEAYSFDVRFARSGMAVLMPGSD
jgi:predicted nucleic-acid-binding protein